ncbi:MAG: L-threonylcarbamoyladenylate synthase [Edaphocola sp.]
MNVIVNTAADTLKAGGAILYPTDTVWGLGCDATNIGAVSRIYRLKQRDEAKSMIILLAEAKDIFKYVANPHPDIVSIIKGFERPTTVIYEQALGLPDNLVNKDGSIAIRVTKDALCKRIIKKLGAPLVSTSANISGEPTPVSYKDISAAIKSSVDYIVPLRQDEEAGAQPSSIVKVGADGQVEVMRA